METFNNYMLNIFVIVSEGVCAILYVVYKIFKLH